MSIATELERIAAAKAALKAAINAKGGNITTETIDRYASAVNAIPQKSGAVIAVTANNQTLSNAYYSGCKLQLSDANLLPENIVEGVTIFGVTGTHKCESGGDDPGDDVVATSEDLVVSGCGLESFNGVYKIQTPGSTGTSRKWVHTSGNSTIYWSGGFFAWHLCEVPNNNGDENDFLNYTESDPTATWSRAMLNNNYNPPTVVYGGESGGGSSSIDPDKVSSFMISSLTYGSNTYTALMNIAFPVKDASATGTSRTWQAAAGSKGLRYMNGAWRLFWTSEDDVNMFYTNDSNPFTSTNWKYINGTAATVTFSDIVTA